MFRTSTSFQNRVIRTTHLAMIKKKTNLKNGQYVRINGTKDIGNHITKILIQFDLRFHLIELEK